MTQLALLTVEATATPRNERICRNCAHGSSIPFVYLGLVALCDTKPGPDAEFVGTFKHRGYWPVINNGGACARTCPRWTESERE